MHNVKEKGGAEAGRMQNQETGREGGRGQKIGPREQVCRTERPVP